MLGVWEKDQLNRPFRNWPLKFKGHLFGLLSIRKKTDRMNLRSNKLVRCKDKREEEALTDSRSYSQHGSDFGLITARLGLLFSRLAAGATAKDDDLKLIEEGQKYFSELLNTLETLQKGGSFESISQHLKYLSFVDNGPQKFQSLGSVADLKGQSKNMLAIIGKQKLDQESLKKLAKLFLTISGWTIESDTTKLFSKNNINEFKFII